MIKLYVIVNGALIMDVEHSVEWRESGDSAIGGRFIYNPNQFGNVIFFYGRFIGLEMPTSEQFNAALKKSPLSGVYKKAQVCFSSKEFFSDALKDCSVKGSIVKPIGKTGELFE